MMLCNTSEEHGDGRASILTSRSFGMILDDTLRDSKRREKLIASSTFSAHLRIHQSTCEDQAHRAHGSENPRCTGQLDRTVFCTHTRTR